MLVPTISYCPQIALLMAMWKSEREGGGEEEGECCNGRLLLSSVNVAHKRQKKMERKKERERAGRNR